MCSSDLADLDRGRAVEPGVGQEWFAHVTCRRQLMAELVHTGEGNGFHPYHDIFHGMVAREREKIASSKKDALLIDHLVEWIDEQGPHFATSSPRPREVRSRADWTTRSVCGACPPSSCQRDRWEA